MPWSLIATVGLQLIDFFLGQSKKRDAAKKSMLDFVARYDKRILDNARLRTEYDKIRRGQAGKSDSKTDS